MAELLAFLLVRPPAGPVLRVGSPPSHSGRAEYAHFSKQGKLLQTYSLDP